MRVVTVELVLDCTEDEEADGVNELLRNQLRQEIGPYSCLIDYCIGDSREAVMTVPLHVDNYTEGDAFVLNRR